MHSVATIPGLAVFGVSIGVIVKLLERVCVLWGAAAAVCHETDDGGLFFFALLQIFFGAYALPISSASVRLLLFLSSVEKWRSCWADEEQPQNKYECGWWGVGRLVRL